MTNSEKIQTMIVSRSDTYTDRNAIVSIASEMAEWKDSEFKKKLDLFKKTINDKIALDKKDSGCLFSSIELQTLLFVMENLKSCGL